MFTSLRTTKFVVLTIICLASAFISLATNANQVNCSSQGEAVDWKEGVNSRLGSFPDGRTEQRTNNAHENAKTESPFGVADNTLVGPRPRSAQRGESLAAKSDERNPLLFLHQKSDIGSKQEAARLFNEAEINNGKHSTREHSPVETTDLASADTNSGNSSRKRVKRYQDESSAECSTFRGSRRPQVFGLRCDDAVEIKDGVIVIRAYEATRIYLIGRNLYSNLTIALTEQEGSPQDDCTHVDRIKSLPLFNMSLNIGEILIDLPPSDKNAPYYLCIREDFPEARWFHQGSESWQKLHVEQEFIPKWGRILMIAVFLLFSGTFSGLNLGLMALDNNELQVIKKCGTADEKRYAQTIEPVRKTGNYLLCAILFSNTLVNSTISVFLEELSTGLIAVISSTILIVLFGEIVPQAFCSRHGLLVGAKTIWLTRLCMLITWPASRPTAWCLDKLFGKEIAHAYDRDQLMEYMKVTSDINNLDSDEVNIIAGALKLKKVQIREVMTKIEDVYMLDENAVLDFDTIQAIVAKGYSRIPVHEAGNKSNIKAVLFAKDLALVDPDDRTPVQTMISFYNHPRMFTYEETTLDEALNEFKTGLSHMAIVLRVINDGDKDPYTEVTGIVTLEDVIEEIMQMEINDETDTLTDNRRKRRRKDAQVRKDFSHFTNLGSGDSSFNVVTPQLCLAAYQYLATTVEPFTPNYLSDSILRRLLSQKIFYKVKMDDDETKRRLYKADEPADYFIMILEGRVHVVCGKENLVFDGGPFSFFGKAALSTPEEPSKDSASSPMKIASVAAAAPRKESAKPHATLSRRESLAKIVAGQLTSLGSASRRTEHSSSVQIDMQPTSSTATAHLSPSDPTMAAAGSNEFGAGENVELVERGAYYFKPDYTVEVIANTSYLKVTRNDYLTAIRATKIERESSALLGLEVEEQNDVYMPPTAELTGSQTLSIEAAPTC